MSDRQQAGGLGAFRAERVLFDEAPDAYDRSRPGYPAAMVTDLVSLAEITSASEILEIGCGTGQLTKALARTGATIDCVELGGNMAQTARTNLSSFPGVTVHQSTFESWDAPPSRYDLVTSAQAFHWIPPEVGYPKCQSLLKPDGIVALIWNLCESTDAQMRSELDRVYERFAPELHQKPPESPETRTQRTLREIRSSGCFVEPSIQRYPWTDVYSTERYADLLRSFSDHRKLGEDRLEQLIAEVSTVIDSHGGTISRDLIAVLFLCHPEPRNR